MKKKLVTMIVTAVITAGLVLTCIPAFAAEEAVDGVKLVEDIATIQDFTDDPVSEEDLLIIINAGINAPSAINSQPWHFAVVTDPAVMEEIATGGDSSGDSGDSDAEAAEGAESAEGESAEGESAEGESDGNAAAKATVGDSPVAIVISCTDGSDFDAGLAAMSMYIEAELLGYGAKLVSSPTIALNGARQDEFREMLGIPADQTAVAVLLIGVPAQDEADIVSSATERNALEDVVSFIAP